MTDKKCISRLTNKSKHAMNTAEYTNKNCIDRSNIELRPYQKEVVNFMEQNDKLLIVHSQLN